MTKKPLKTQCCITGGGPAGMILGYLLARKGIDVTVLEKWPDFFRDFRGDTIHPSTMNLLEDLGILEDFFKLPIQKTYQMSMMFDGKIVTVADFKKTKMKHPFIAFVPQWDFLNFIKKHAEKHPNFHLRMETEATDLIEKNGKIVGVKATHKKEKLEIQADLVVGADGRDSTVRQKAKLEVEDFGAPMDVLWFRISREKTDPKNSFGSIEKGRMMIMIQRGKYWQAGFVIKKGGFKKIKSKGLKSFKKYIQTVVPFLEDRVEEIESWEQVKSLEVKVNRLKEWARDGLLCIGDAAHAMSPIGGLGINVAIQDAIAAANVLVPVFKKGTPNLSDLEKIQKRRQFSVTLTQRFQLILQKRMIEKVLKKRKKAKIPLLLRLFQYMPLIRRIPPYFIGKGVRAERLGEEVK